MATIPLPPDFREFLKLLNEHEVRYLLIGGHAVGYHGYVRATADMDIWVEPEVSNAKRVVKVILEFGFEVENLKQNKRASGRMKDLTDLEHLE